MGASAGAAGGEMDACPDRRGGSARAPRRRHMLWRERGGKSYTVSHPGPLARELPSTDRRRRCWMSRAGRYQ